MIVLVRVEVDDEQRRAINARMGRPGLATRYTISSLVDMMLQADLQDAVAELRAKAKP